MSIRAKIVVSLLFASILISGEAAGCSYWLLQDSLFSQFRSQLKNIAHIGAETIDSSVAKRLIAQMDAPLTEGKVREVEQSRDYRIIDDKLQAIRNSEPTLIQYIYILVPTDDPNITRFLVDADILLLTARQSKGKKVDEEISHFGADYDISKIGFIKQAFASHALAVEDELVSDPVYHTRSLSAYAPLFDEDKRMIGVLGVDLKDENMQVALRHSKIVSAALIFASLPLAIILSVFLGYQLTRGIRLLNQVVIRFAQRQFDVRAPVLSRDEIGNLSKSFNAMAQTIDDHAKYLASLLTAYGRFVPHSFLDLLQKTSVIDLQLGDHIQREMTVLFADIRSFTTLSEGMTPKENFDFVNAFLRRVGPVIRNNGGVIDKYIGDAVMALFPSSPDSAVVAALEMQHKVAEYNRERERHGRQPIRIGVGLHTGSLILGTVGEAERMNSTVIADAVNLASRLEALTKHYGVGIILSDASVANLNSRSPFILRFLDKVQVKGKHNPVAIYQVLDCMADGSEQVQERAVAQWQNAVDRYLSQQFDEALVCFQQFLMENPDDQPAQLYVRRIK